MDKITELRKLYGRTKGILSATTAANVVHRSIYADYNHIIDLTSDIIQEDISYFRTDKLPKGGLDSKDPYVWHEPFRSKILQYIGYMESSYNVSDTIVEIGSLYNSIKDSELRDRCGDLLTATGHFDRVVNQATQILEIRVRTKASLPKTDFGVSVINNAIKSNPLDTIILISDIPSEQEGFANICRGIMQALRNETHHKIAEFTREDAFAVCVFIDRLLRIIDSSAINKIK